MKRAVDVNISYFKKHFEEIINNTQVLLPEWLFMHWEISGSSELNDFWRKLVQKHRRESGNWYIFGRGEWYVNPGEHPLAAEDRIVKEYCETTGHWDLFIWEDVNLSY